MPGPRGAARGRLERADAGCSCPSGNCTCKLGPDATRAARAAGGASVGGAARGTLRARWRRRRRAAFPGPFHGMGFRQFFRSNVAVLCAVVVVEFALFEAGFRLKGGSEAAPEFQRLFMPDPHAPARTRRPPGSRPRISIRITINQAGVRDREVAPKAAGERRIVVLGDSW